MQLNLEQQIRERAYHLWLARGRREGEADQHWLAAEREVLAAFAATKPPRGSSRPATAMAGKAPRRARRQAAA